MINPLDPTRLAIEEILLDFADCSNEMDRSDLQGYAFTQTLKIMKLLEVTR